MKNFFFLGLVAFALFSTGCGSDDDGNISNPGFCTNAAFSEALNAAVMNLSDAATLYGTDPTPANCNAYKAAARNYLDEIKRFESCATINSLQSFQDSLREAEESVDMITC
jgi:hypothetical protein